MSRSVTREWCSHICLDSTVTGQRGQPLTREVNHSQTLTSDHAVISCSFYVNFFPGGWRCDFPRSRDAWYCWPGPQLGSRDKQTTICTQQWQYLSHISESWQHWIINQPQWYAIRAALFEHNGSVRQAGLRLQKRPYTNTSYLKGWSTKIM